jgi:hypothetical protein
MVPVLLALALSADPAVSAPSTAPAERAAAAADTVTFRYAWPAGFTAAVEYRSVKVRDGKLAGELSLRSELQAVDRGDERVIGFRGWTGSAAADPLVAASGRIEWVVGRDGAFRRLEGMEEALEALRSLTKGLETHAPGAAARLEKMAPAALTKDASETWAMLVQFWNGESLDVGEDYESDSTVPVAVVPGERVRLLARIKVQRRLPCPGARGACVEVTMRSQPDAEDVARILRRLLGELTAGSAQLAQLVGALGEASAATEYALVTDPATLIPYRLTKVRTITVAAASGPPAGTAAATTQRRDETTWTFSYPGR